jgi:quercetin dioxygenase-like cupin family protein
VGVKSIITNGAPSAEKLGEMVEYQSGAIVSRTLLKAPHGSTTLFAFDAGQELSEHTTPHEALLVVIEGETVVSIRGDAYHLHTGDAISLPANQPHAVKATKQFKMLLVMLDSRKEAS